MRVQSKFHDYYDSVRAYGFDPKLVYNRKTEETYFEWIDQLRKNMNDKVLERLTKLLISAPDHNLVDSRMIIGFCGHLHLAYMSTVGIGTFFSPDEVLMAAASRGETRRCRWPRYMKRHSFDSKGYADWMKTVPIDNDEVFRHFDTPIFIIREYYHQFMLIKNPCLREFDFQRVVDPWTASQEIAQYLGNNLVVQVDPTANISDEDMAAMKGHGGKYSFRTPPKKRR